MGYTGHTRVDAIGFSGGIWVYWRPEEVTVEPIIKHNQHITINITRVGATPWYFTAVYASPDPSKRQELWKELQEFATTHNIPWMIAGDFNDTRFPSERNKSCTETDRRSTRFNDWVNDMDLLEVEFTGAAHTWARGLSPETRQSARLDRAFCNGNWGLRFDRAKVKHLPASHSDHCPIFVSPNGFVPIQSINRPFRFQATWLSHEKFTEFVTDKWETNRALIPALEHLSEELQSWNKNVFGNIFHQKRSLLARLEGVQKSLSIKVNNGLLKLESKMRRELDEVLDREETLWYQKSRIDWLKDGDRKTTFFHLSTIVRRWRNKISAIKGDDGEWIHDKEAVKAHFVDYFIKLFTEEGNGDLHNIPQDVFPELSQRDWNYLSLPYSKTDIDGVIKEMDSLKAPGPDGYQALFFQKHWDLVSKYVYELALPVLEGKGIPDKLNDTHIALIPKVENPESPAQFRPIGLCNVIYKVITKVLINRIKPLLPTLISNTQSSFVSGRQITYNIVIVQEVLHTMKRKQGNKGLMAIKRL